MCDLCVNTLLFTSTGPDHAAESIEGMNASSVIYTSLSGSIMPPACLPFICKHVFIISFHALLRSGPAPVTATAGGDARAPHPETAAARAPAPERGGGGTAAGPAPAAEDTATATRGAPNTSERRQIKPETHF